VLVNALDPNYVRAMTKIDDGFALADRIVAAARGGSERALLTDMIEECGNDADVAVAVIARLVSHLSGRSSEEMAEAERRANIPAPLGSGERLSAGLVLP
jgi:hypothetical protein